MRVRVEKRVRVRIRVRDRVRVRGTSGDIGARLNVGEVGTRFPAIHRVNGHNPRTVITSGATRVITGGPHRPQGDLTVNRICAYVRVRV